MSDTVNALRGQAERLQRSGRHREAVAVYRQLLARHPELADGWYNLGWLLKAEGELEARDARVVTDKRPDNFLLVGLIKRLFPAAKIVHTVRAPLDNGLSVYFQHLDQAAASYSSDLGDIGHFYGQHRRLMAHWRGLFPDDIFDFDYDRFVSEPAPVLKPLLEFLGLEWDERCLAFHERPGTVKTASYWQVRRPLYTDASGRWRHYAAHLEPLRAALQEAGVDAER